MNDELSADFVCIAEDNAAARGICLIAEKRDRCEHRKQGRTPGDRYWRCLDCGVLIDGEV